MGKQVEAEIAAMEKRTAMLKAAVKKLNNADRINALFRAWDCLAKLWDHAASVRRQAAGLYVDAVSVRDFLGSLDRVLCLNLPQEVIETLEGRANG